MWPEYYTGSDDYFRHRTISETWNCRSCTGNRIRTVCTDCDLYSCISEKTKAGGLPSGIFAFDQRSDEAALQYRCAGYFEYGVDSVLTTALNAILAAFSQTYVLVLGIYYNCKRSLYMPANGIIQGMRPLIGYNYGAGEHKRVEQLYRLTLLLNICIMTAGMILCLTIPGN